MVRVAALQFASTTDVEANLETCLRMIDQAARQRPQLIVLPEFSNHLSWYEDAEHAARVAVTPRGEFVSEVAHRAQKHGCHIVLNVSLAREEGRITVSSLLFDDMGELLAEADKQTLMGHENDFFATAEDNSPVADAGFARVGMYPCRDGVTMETPRGLALRGAQILCNSLNSFAFDEAALHVPVRAAENSVFVVAANKVGPLVPQDQLAQVSEATHIPERHLYGAGESQIVGPDGRVLAKADRDGDAVVVAEFDPAEADDKRRPDGTDRLMARRPNLYRALSARPRRRLDERPSSRLRVGNWDGPDASGDEAIDQAVACIQTAAEEDVELLVMPELFCFGGGVVEDAELAAEHFERYVRALCEACGDSPIQVVTSLVERTGDRLQHMGVLLGGAGIIARQAQLHVPERHRWADPGKRLDTFKLPWGRLVLLVGDDACFPELARLAALSGAHVAACPIDVQERWECELGLLSRAAENRMVLVAASRPTDLGGGVVLDLPTDFTLMTPWEERTFDGYIAYPTVVDPDEPLTITTLHPSAADNKLLSHATDLLEQRPWRLCQDLVRRGLPERPAQEQDAPASSEHDEARADTRQDDAYHDDLERDRDADLEREEDDERLDEDDDLLGGYDEDEDR